MADRQQDMPRIAALGPALEPSRGGSAVVDRGGVRFEYPSDWVVVPEHGGSIAIHDRPPPDDSCTLQMTVLYLNPEADWSLADPEAILDRLHREDTRLILERGAVQTFRRDGAAVAWSEIRLMDPGEARPARSRMCLARWGNIQPLITLDYWEGDAGRCIPVWDALMDSLHFGDDRPVPGAGSEPTGGP